MELMEVEEEQEKSRKKYTRWTKEKTDMVERLFESGCKMAEIAELVGMSVQTVQLYIDDHVSDELGRPWAPFIPSKQAEKSSTLDRRKKLLDIVLDDNSLNQVQIMDRLPPDLQCSRRTLQGDLRKQNITRKRLRHMPIERNDPTTISVRQAYAIEINSIVDEKLYFIDETGTNLHTNTHYG